MDCGGATSCPRCGTGDECDDNSDCASRHCDDGSCVAPSCTDNIVNGSEADVDCGGSCSSKCEPGDDCLVPADCTEGVCSGGTCAEPTCNDDVVVK